MRPASVTQALIHMNGNSIVPQALSPGAGSYNIMTPLLRTCYVSGVYMLPPILPNPLPVFFLSEVK